MSASDALDSCDCCEGIAVLTPQSLDNLPGLSQLVYRVGTHGSFKHSMLARLAGMGDLSRLTTRADDDPSIALLDAAATMLDVLTFYQERIANEGFLRTATERRSVLELARAIGYELNPGVAASAYLAFTLETTPGAPAVVNIPEGVRVLSIPGPDELPQPYETVEQIEARPEWNALRPSLVEVDLPGFMDRSVYLAGISNNIKPGDNLLIVGDERLKEVGSERWDFRQITAIETFPPADGIPAYTKVTLNRGLGTFMPSYTISPTGQNPRVFVFRARANLFGFNAPDWRNMANNIWEHYLATHKESTTEKPPDLDLDEWPKFTITDISGKVADEKEKAKSADDEDDEKEKAKPRETKDPKVYYLHLDAIYPQVTSDSWIVLSQAHYQELYRVKMTMDDSRRGFNLLSKTTRLMIEGENLYLKFDTHIRDTVVYLQPEELAFADPPRSEPLEGKKILLDRYVTGLAERRTVLVNGRRMRAKIVTSASLKMTTLDGAQEIALSQDDTLIVTKSPLQNIVAKRTTWTLMTRDGMEGTLTVYPAQVQYAAPEDGDPFVSEPAVIAHINPVASGRPGEVLSELEFSAPLSNTFDRPSVTIFANAVLSTHGETKTEILGSGDASQGMQKFVLKNKPLTYTSASTASGGRSTLEVRVNDILWNEVASLYGQDGRQQVYITRLADDGSVTIQFGDGQTGARLPSGVDNVRAVYRVGAGSPGLLHSDQLSLLVTRPLGVQKTTNPIATVGAADPERLDEARQNAPFTVLTLDRIVSLQDFEDFARAFSGIGKAQATLVWTGEQRMVHLTIAASTSKDGLDYTVDPKSQLYSNLRRAIDLARDTTQQLQIDSYIPLFFRVDADVQFGPAYSWEKVKSAVRAALQTRFNFANSTFGQPVHTSDVLALIQNIEGVKAAFLKKLYLRGRDDSSVNPVLSARRAYQENGKFFPAELLLIDASSSAAASGQTPGINIYPR